MHSIFELFMQAKMASAIKVKLVTPADVIEGCTVLQSHQNTRSIKEQCIIATGAVESALP